MLTASRASRHLLGAEQFGEKQPAVAVESSICCWVSFMVRLLWFFSVLRHGEERVFARLEP